MKVFLILLAVASFCHIISTQSDAAPEFKNAKDGPYNVSVGEGESVTFNCNPYAKPQAIISWFHNGQPIDTENPPERFSFSNDLKSLTIRDVCRDCVDRESKTDLMVIQCNASNVHGYAFAQGYLNILKEGKEEEETKRAWIIIVGAGAVGFILLLIGIFLPSRSGDVYRLTKERKMPNPYETHHSVNVPLEGVEDDKRSMRNGFSPMYEQIGYNSIGQVHEEVRRESATLYVDGSNRYESLVASPQEVNLYSELRPIEVNPCTEPRPKVLCSKDVIPHFDLDLNKRMPNATYV